MTVPLAIVVAAAPAHADDDGTTKLKQLVTDATNWTKAGLDKVGPLAQALPLLATSPGSLVEADKLLELANPHLQSALNQDVDLGGGSRLYSTLTGTPDNYLLDVKLLVKKQVVKQNLTSAGVTATEAVNITGWATVRLKMRYTPADGAYLVADSEAPRIDIDARAQFRPDLSAAKASIGILAVALTGGSLDARTHLVVTVNDPNHDGKLAFGTGGELSAAGSLAGLVQAGFDATGGGKISDTEDESGPGSFHANVDLGAALEGAPAGLPASISANIKVDWNDISVGTPTLTTSGLDGVLNKFQNMSPLDLAAGIAQLATLIEAVQRSGGAGNLNLPFLRGTFADAVKINEKLVAFLDEFVYPKPGDPDFGPDDDPARAGQPKFSSIQELLKLLNDKGLLSNTPITYENDKLSFKLTYTKTSTEEQPLDPGADKVSGLGATFLPNGFQVDDDRFVAGTLVGQRVVAGTSAGTIKSNTANAIELEEAAWIGGQPADDATWVISSSDPHIGAVELGGMLAGTTTDGKKIGAKAANAQSSLAKVTPSYSATVTVVLNLADNVAVPTDRVMLRTTAGEALFSADFPITTVTEFFTTLGFLRIKIAGDIELGPATSGAKMLEVKWDKSEDISLGTLFQQLKDTPGNLLDVGHSVKATGQVAVSLPGDTGPMGSGVAVRLSWVAGQTPFVDTTQLTRLFTLDFDPDDPAALFSLVVKSLQLVNSALASDGDGGLLDQEIPLVGKTARELIGSDESGVGKDITYTADGTNFILKDASRSGSSEFKDRLKNRTIIIGTKAYRVLEQVDGQQLKIAGGAGGLPEPGAAYALRPEMIDAMEQLLANPPETLQDALDMVNKVIGEGSGLSFKFDQRVGGPYIRLGLDWKRNFHTGRPINLNWSGVGDLVSLDSSGAVYLDITGSATFGLLIPLKLDGAPKLDHTSNATVQIKAGADNVVLAARAGPLGINVGTPENPAKVQADLKFTLSPESTEDQGVLEGLLDLKPELTTDGTNCGGDPVVGGADTLLCARAPITINDCDPGSSDNTLTFTVSKTFAVGNHFPELGTCLENLVLKFTDFNVGIDGYLAKLEEALRLASFDGKLPLVGDDLQQGERFIHELREDIKAKIGTALANTPPDSLSDALAAKLTEELQKIDPGMTVVITCQGASPCGLPSVQSVRIKMVKQKGDPNAATGCTDLNADNKCLGKEVPLDLGLPGLSLKARKGQTGGIGVGLGWKLHLEFVLDRTEGFYIATRSDTQQSPELQIGAFFDAGDLDAQLAFIQVSAKKKPDHANIPLARAYFAIDLKGSAGETPCFENGCAADADSKLTLSEFADLTDLVATRVSADVDILWELEASISTNPDNEAGSVLPGIVVDFKLKWGISNHTGSLTAGNLDIGFSNFQLDVGTFFTKILKPVLDKVKTITEPLQPIIDTLYAPIPVLSDLSHAVGGPDITLIWLAETFSTLAGGPSLKFVHTIRNIVQFINNMPKCETSCRIPIGSFKVLANKALDTLADPSNADSLIDSNNQTVENVKAGVDSKTTGTKLFSSPGGLAAEESGSEKIGFSFPIFDNPKSLFGLLLGKDVELISFDSGPLALGFSWRQSFGPVYAPPPVFITLSGSASVTARFVAGLDTKGIRHAYEALTGDADLSVVGLLDGLYFKTHDADGKAIPVVQLRGEIAAGAEVSVVIIKVGIEGGLSLTVGFHWNDPNNDGKFRLSEFIQRLKVSPICLFTTSGELRIFLRLYFEINLFLFKKRWTFTIVNAVLLDFKAQPDCEPDPPELGGVIDDANDDTLVVYAGKFGTGAIRQDPAWDNAGKGDVLKVYALHFADVIEKKEANPTDDFDGFVVEGLGRRQEFRTSEFPNLKRVIVDGRGYSVPADKTAMSVVFLSDGDPAGGQTAKKYSFEKTAVVIGSEGNDNIRLGTGESYVDGRAGIDTIVTANDDPAVKVRIAGGEGDDNITTGNGNAYIAGDSSLNPTSLGNVTMHNSPGPDTLSGVVDWNALADPSNNPEVGDGNDTVTVGFGANRVYGNFGDDVLATMVKDGKANGDNVFVGGNGNDTINGGNGNDKIYTYSELTSDVDAVGHGSGSQVDSVDTGKGEDDVHGSQGVDLVVSHSANGQTGEIFGYGGNDVLLGGYGTDRIFGGPDQDYVIAEPSDVEDAGSDDGYGPFRKVTHQALPSGTTSQNKLLVGGLGKDHIIGGDGGATIFGDKHLTDETCADNANHVQVTPANQGEADLILGGAGVEIVTAGSGDDRSDLGNGDDRACGQLGNDVLALGGGNDKAWGGDGADQITGADGEDVVYGNVGNDALYGGPAKDILEGNADSDAVYGDAGDDLIFGGTRLAGEPDASDYLYGDAGEDSIVGDNGSAVAYPLDLDGLNPSAGAGDVISGGLGNDKAYGGLGPDAIHGDWEIDHLEGNNDTDTIHGDAGNDVIIGGSSEASYPDKGDFLYGDTESDLIAGDNARFETGTPTRITQGRGSPERTVTLLDLGLSPDPAKYGADYISGGSSDDLILGQNGTDRITGGAGDDYAEGGPGLDWVEGNLGQDDLVGGSYLDLQPDGADMLFGGPQTDVILGDNGSVLRLLGGDQPTSVTVRLGADGTPMIKRKVLLSDTSVHFGADRINGGDDVDVAWGQDGDDVLHGNGDGDYIEGNGGADSIRGDAGFTTLLPDPGWPLASTVETLTAPDGQDDLLGGSSVQGFRDTGDTIRGDGHDDVILGDNGSLLRTILNGAEKVYTERYPTGADLSQATRVRSHDPALPGPSTRFCTTAQATCEVAGAFGADQLFGDGGNDGIWGQDGDDTVYGGDGNDDIFGELGADVLFGEAGHDAILGDRGGVMNEYINADDVTRLGFTVTLSSVPQETYTAFRLGTYDRRVDLFHDTDGDAWVGASNSMPMPHDSFVSGGDDRIRGGSGRDNIHGGYGEDLMNGDSGGDEVFGGDGSDMLWGGKGCDPVLDLGEPECLTNGVFNPDSRGSQDQYVDHLWGGAGATTGPSVEGILSSDLHDFKPRGAYPGNCTANQFPESVGTTSIDPCTWFEMTDMTNASDADNQHHQGTDWMYGGWDRDVMQGDVAQNGPNAGDRMFDWNGAYNLYTHCNAAYGGYNDIRQHSPAMQDFLTRLAYANGLGRSYSDVAGTGTAAYLELAYVYPRDNKDQAVGVAYPGTPGHFDDPTSCTD